MRLFVALWPGDGLRAAAADTAESLRRAIGRGPVRFVRPELIHLTLRFLGEVDDAADNLQRLESTLGAAASEHPPLSLRLGDLDCFPSIRRPRVLWIGLTGDLTTLAQLREAVAKCCAPFASQPDETGFHPHLTLARLREPRRSDVDRIAEALARIPAPVAPAWNATELCLVESQLRPEGPCYAIRKAFMLGTATTR